MSSIQLLWFPNVTIEQNGDVRFTGTLPENLRFVEDETKLGIYYKSRWQLLNRKYLYWFSRFKFPECVDLRNVTFYQLPYPCKDGTPNLHAVFKQPIEIQPGFRLCPSRPSIAVSITGDVLRLNRGKIAKCSLKSGYWVVTVYNPMLMHSSIFPVHRAVANAWVYKNQNAVHPEVNHIDGNKRNKLATNLEWCTRSQNSYHLHHTGLGSTVKSCKVQDILTHEIHSFATSTEAAEFIGIPTKQLQSAQQYRTNPFFENRYEFRYDDDARPWYVDDNTEVLSFGSARYLFYVYEDPDSPHRKLFNGVQSFRRHYRLWKILGGHGREAGTMDEVCAEFRRRFPQFRLEVVNTLPTLEIEVRDINTGEISTFQTASDAAKFLKTDICNVCRKAKLKGTSLWRNYQIRYKSNSSWPENVKSSSACMLYQLRHRETGNCKLYESQQQVADAVGCSRATVSKALIAGEFSEYPYSVTALKRYT